MMASFLMPKMVVSDGDWEMDWQTLSKDLVAADNWAQRTVLVHMYRRNHGAQGRSNNNTGPVATVVAELRGRDFPVISQNRSDGNKAKDAGGPTLVAFRCALFVVLRPGCITI